MPRKNAGRILFAILFVMALIGTASALNNTPPIANFSANATTICKSGTVQFIDTSTGSPTSWFWFILPNWSSYQQNPVRRFDTVGSYTVTLTAMNEFGSNNKTRANYITVINCTPTPTPTPTPVPTRTKKPKNR